MTKPLKTDAQLPVIDSKLFFKESADYGIDIQIEPSLKYEINDKLVQLARTQHDEVQELINKFLPELDSELLTEMDKYIKANLGDKAL